MKRALITTTINVPTILRTWAKMLSPGDHIIVTGDHKSPHKTIHALMNEIDETTGIVTTYLEPEDQMGWKSSEVIGWNCIQRRNIALLEALSVKPDYIITVDDDNRPSSSDWVNAVDKIMSDDTSYGPVVSANDGWFNVGDLCVPRVTHRGYPLDRRHQNHTFEDVKVVHRAKPIGVFASLWTGDPDIDAIERIVDRPNVVDINDDVILEKGTWCPFNSQATAYRTEVAPMMLMWPGCGRYDDIWSSYAARAAMDAIGWYVWYGFPLVHQDRNEHNLVTDMKNEMFGYEYTPRLIGVLRDIAGDLHSRMTPLEAISWVWSALVTEPWLPDQTIAAFSTWVDDLHTLGVNK